MAARQCACRRGILGLVNCFDNDDNGLIPASGFSLTQSAPQPTSATADSRYHLGDGFSSFDPEPLVDRSWAHGLFTFYHKVWGSRLYRAGSNTNGDVGGYINSRFSFYPPNRVDVTIGGDTREARFNYDTMARANAALVVGCMETLGYTRTEILADSYVTGVFVAGDLLEDATFLASPETYCTISSGGDDDPNEFWSGLNKVLMPAAKLASIPGVGNYIKIDWEQQDGRSEADTLALITHIAGLCHAKSQKLLIWPNTLDNSGARYSGLSAVNLYAIQQAVDGLSFLVYDDGGSQTRVEQAQAAWDLVEAGGPVDVDKIVITFSLGNPDDRNTTVQDAIDIRRWMKERGIYRVNFWRNGATQEGACDTDANQKILAFLGANVPRPSTNVIQF